MGTQSINTSLDIKTSPAQPGFSSSYCGRPKSCTTLNTSVCWHFSRESSHSRVSSVSNGFGPSKIISPKAIEARWRPVHWPLPWWSFPACSVSGVRPFGWTDPEGKRKGFYQVSGFDPQKNGNDTIRMMKLLKVNNGGYMNPLCFNLQTNMDGRVYIGATTIPSKKSSRIKLPV